MLTVDPVVSIDLCPEQLRWLVGEGEDWPAKLAIAEKLGIVDHRA